MLRVFGTSYLFGQLPTGLAHYVAAKLTLWGEEEQSRFRARIATTPAKCENPGIWSNA